MIKDYLSSIFYRGLLIFSNQLFIFILFVILANSIDIEIFNEFAMGIVLIQTSWLLSKYGIELYSIEFASSEKSNFNFLITNNLIVTFIFYLLFFTIIIFFIKINYINFNISILYSIIPAAILGGLYPVWFFQAIDKIDRLIKVNTYSKIITLLFIYIFNEYIDLETIFIIFGLSFVPPVIASYIYILRHDFFDSFKSEINLRIFLKKSTPYFFKNILCNQINYLWLISFLLFGPAIQIGVYTIADQFYKFLNTLSNFISQVLRVKFLKLKNNKFKDDVYKFYLFIILIIIFFSLFISFLFVNYLFEINLSGHISLLHIFLLIFLFSSLSKYQIINNEKLFFMNTHLYSVVLFIHFLLIVFGVIIFDNITSYAFMYLFASIIQYTFCIYYSRFR